MNLKLGFLLIILSSLLTYTLSNFFPKFNIDLKNIPEIYLILLGAILAFISTTLVETLKDRSEQKKISKNFTLLIKLELNTISKTLEKIQTALDYANYYDYLLLDRADKSLSNLEKTQSDAIHISSPEIQEKFVDLVSDISSYISDIRNTQRLYYDEFNKAQNVKDSKKGENTKRVAIQRALDTFEKRKTQKTIEHVEIKRRLDALIRGIDE